MPTAPVLFRLLFLCVVLALGGLVWLRPDLLPSCAFDPAAFAEQQEREARARHRQEMLDEHSRVLQQRLDAKEGVMQELLAGRLTLLQAARRFKDLNETPVTCQNDYRSRFPGRSDGEKVCRQVLQWLEGYLLGLPSEQAQTLRRRFADELREHLEHHDGIVVLPE